MPWLVKQKASSHKFVRSGARKCGISNVRNRGSSRIADASRYLNAYQRQKGHIRARRELGLLGNKVMGRTAGICLQATGAGQL